MNTVQATCTICTLCAVVLAITGCGIPQAKQDQFNVATSLVRSMSAGNFESAVEKFDAELKNSWPPEKLAIKWHELEARFGEFESIGYFGDSNHIAESPENVPIFVSCEFKDGGCTVLISLNQTNQISSIEFEDGAYVPPEEGISDLPEEHRDAALGMIRTMAAGSFDEVFSKFDSELKDYLPLEKLEKNWSHLENQYGAFEDIGGFDGRLLLMDDNRSLSTVVIRCRFQRGESMIVISIDSEDQVSSVTFADPALQD